MRTSIHDAMSTRSEICYLPATGLLPLVHKRFQIGARGWLRETGWGAADSRLVWTRPAVTARRILAGPKK